MFQLLDDNVDDERHSKLLCASCARLRYRLPLSHELISEGLPFCTRVELTDDYGEGGDAAATLRDALSESGYGFGGDPPLADADCVVLCDMLVSGLGKRCLWIDLSDSAVGDAGLVSLARGLPACLSLLHLNLNGTSAGDEGVAALAAALTPKPFASLSPAARILIPPHAASEERREATGWSARSSGPGPVVTTVTCPQLRWLYLVLDALGDAGAIALAGALNLRATPKLECLWCCGAFSAASQPGAAGGGFTALTRACDARGRSGALSEDLDESLSGAPLVLELEHGLPWGM